MTTVSPQQPPRHTRGSFVASNIRPTKPKENTEWTNPSTGLKEIFQNGIWRGTTSSASLQVTNNLSDLGSAATARSNLGLGTWAVQNTASTGTHTMAEGANIVLGTSTGTKIGTAGGSGGQKLAFFNSTPIVQPLLATGAGNTVDNVITALQNLGLVRQS